MSRETDRIADRRGMALCFGLALMLVLYACCGCAYTNDDWTMICYAVAGQAADAASTQYALDQGFVERNDYLYGDSPSWRDMAKVKIPLLLLAWVCGEVWPEHRGFVYGIVGTTGLAAGAWNTAHIMRYDGSDR